MRGIMARIHRYYEGTEWPYLSNDGVVVLFVQNLAVASRRAACSNPLRIDEASRTMIFSSH
jgi:hypothetical protein